MVQNTYEIELVIVEFIAQQYIHRCLDMQCCLSVNIPDKLIFYVSPDHEIE